MDTTAREARHAQMRAEAQNSTRTIPVSPIFAPAQATVPPKSKRFDFLKKIEKKWYWIGGASIALIVLALYLLGRHGGLPLRKGDGGATPYGFASEPTFTSPDLGTDPTLGFTPQAPEQLQPLPLEAPPVAPPENPLNFKGSIDSRGFLGKVQSLIFVIGLGVLMSLIGDIIYREQWLDGVVAVAMTIMAIAIVLPDVGIAWVGVILFLVELAFVIAVSLATGKDFSPIAAHFLLVAVFGGLIFTRIGAIQSIFPRMVISSVPPIAQLGYFFSTMNFAAMAFPMIVYLYFLIGTILSIVESVRPSGEDKSSRWGSLVAGGFGLLAYFFFLLVVHLVPWVSFLIAFLLTVAGSAAVRSQPAKQWVSPKWSVRSPFDGAMLFTAILLMVVVIFGQQWWLIGVL